MEKKKKSFSYATFEDIQKRAKVVAAKEGTTVSELVHNYLKEYIKPKKKRRTVLHFGSEQYELK